MSIKSTFIEISQVGRELMSMGPTHQSVLSIKPETLDMLGGGTFVRQGVVPKDRGASKSVMAPELMEGIFAPWRKSAFASSAPPAAPRCKEQSNRVLDHCIHQRSGHCLSAVGNSRLP
jgi:hypothetical protein